MNPRPARGFGLVELMVALALALLVSVAALGVQARAAADARTAGAMQQLHEAARAAAELLERELRGAGHLGPAPGPFAVAGRVPAGTRGTGLGTDACGPALPLDLERAVDAADGYALAPGRALACAPRPSGRAMPDADTLTIRRARYEPSASEPGRLQLAATRARGALFDDGRTPSLGPGTAVHDLEAGVYYVSADSSAGRGVPSLRRHRLVGGPAGPAFQDEELVVGVEDLQIALAIDGPDADEIPERWVAPHERPADGEPRLVRFRLQVRSAARDQRVPRALPAVVGTGFGPASDPYPDRADGFRRVVVVRTVHLRNLRRG